MNDELEQRKDVRCSVCGEWMAWGTEYYDADDKAYCPDHRP